MSGLKSASRGRKIPTSDLGVVLLGLRKSVTSRASVPIGAKRLDDRANSEADYDEEDDHCGRVRAHQAATNEFALPLQVLWR